MQRWLLGGLLAVCALAEAAPSFDCKRASTRIERQICSDAELSTLDAHLARYFQAAAQQLGSGAQCLQEDQRRWLREQRGRCSDVACLRKAYLERLATLDPLQPGATTADALPLPPVRRLAWIVPPAEDSVAAPPNPDATPMEVSGHLDADLDESSDGPAIVTEDGQRYTLAMLMFVEANTIDRLTAAARESSRAVARGRATTDGERRVFDPSHCVFVYLEPTANAE